MSTYALIVPAAGTGTRMHSELPKQFADINGVPTLTHVLRVFQGDPRCVEIVIPVAADYRESAVRCVPNGMNVSFVDGGASRQRSVGRAVMSLQSDAKHVLVHDAARPCLRGELVDRIVLAMLAFGAAIPVLPVTDTIKRVDEAGIVMQTIDRDSLRVVQTPQGFLREWLVAAHKHASDNTFNGTDDAMLIEAIGHKVHTVPGDPTNIKITVAADISVAERTFDRL